MLMILLKGFGMCWLCVDIYVFYRGVGLFVMIVVKINLIVD